MNVGASISSLAALRLPVRLHCFRTSKPLFSFPSLPFLDSASFRFFSSMTSSITASMTTDQLAVDDKKPAPQPPKPWLIVGLGNPGKLYDRTRHNVGFEMVDSVAEAEGISMSSVSFKAQIGKGFIGNVPVMLVKPQTFMNASGVSVGAIVSYHKIPLNQVLVIFDDLDLPFAKLRMLPKGGHGGHNGMKSIIDHLKGGRDFPRLRIGIGRPPGKMNAANFVMRSFSKQEREELDFTLRVGVDAIRILLLEGFNKSATFVNTNKPLEQIALDRIIGEEEVLQQQTRQFLGFETPSMVITFTLPFLLMSLSFLLGRNLFNIKLRS